MSESGSLVEQARLAVRMAVEALAGTPDQAKLDNLTERLDEPLRVAIAGRVKAGKSTLLNALVGQELAPTDAGECTKIITWYRDGVTYRVTMHPVEGEPQQVPFTRDGGAIQVQLGEYRPEAVEMLVVDWPSESLRPMTLIDTPGIASASTEISERTVRLLTSGDDEPAASDAVLYLMHHLHTTDVRFLDAFRDRDVSQPAPINSIGVLSRADEIGAGKLDAMETAERIAGRYREDRKVRALCQTVIPVAALLAQAGETLTEDEFQSLHRIAAADEGDLTAMLLSADRFLAPEVPAQVGPRMREHLVARMGLFGVRLAVARIQEGVVRNATELAAELVRRSGLGPLRDALLTQFAARRDVLKARSTLAALGTILEGHDTPEAERVAGEVERIRSGAHEFSEIRLLNAIRSGAVAMRPNEEVDAERLLGATGASLPARLGLPPQTDPGQLRSALLAAITRWRTRAENPMSSREVVEAAGVLTRTAEGLLAALPPG